MSLYEPLHWFTQRVPAHLPAWSTTRMVAQRMLYLLSLLALASLSRFPCWLCVLAGAWAWDEANSRLEQKDWVWRTRYSRFEHQRITRLQQQRIARLACDSDSSAPAPPVPPSPPPPPVPPHTPPTASVPCSMRDDEELSAHSNSATCASIPGRAQPTLPALFPGYSTPSFHRRSFGSRYAGFIPSKPCVSPPPVAAATSYSSSPACARTPVPVRTSPAHPVASPGYSTPSLHRRSFGSRSAAFVQSKPFAPPTPVAATTPLQSSTRRQASSSAIKTPKLVDSRSSRMSTRTTPASVVAPSARPGAHVSSPSPSHGYSTDSSPLSNASSSMTTTTHQLVWPSFLPRPPSSSSSSCPSTAASPTSLIFKPNVPETNVEEKEVRALAPTATSIWPSFLPRPPSSSSSSRPSTPASPTSLIVKLDVPETYDEEKKPVDTARSPSVAPGPAEYTKLPTHNIFGSVIPSWCLPINEPSTSIPTASQPATPSSPVAAPTLSRKRTMQNFFFDMPITLLSPAGDRAPSSSVAAPELAVEMDIDEREVEESKPVAAAFCALTALASSTSTILNIVDSPMPGVFPVSDEASLSGNNSLDALIGTVTSSAELNMDEDMPVADAPSTLITPTRWTVSTPEFFDSPMPLASTVGEEASSSTSVTSAELAVEMDVDKRDVEENKAHAVFASSLRFHSAARHSFTAQTAAATPSALAAPAPSTRPAIPDFFSSTPPAASLPVKQADSPAPVPSFKRLAPAASTPSTLAAPAPSTKPAGSDFVSSTPPATPLPVKHADRPAPAPSFERLVSSATTTATLAAPAPSTKPAGPDFVSSTPPATPLPVKQADGPATQIAASTPSTLAAPAPSTKPAGSDFVSSTPPPTPLPVKQADRPAPAPSLKGLAPTAAAPSPLPTAAPSTKPARSLPLTLSSTPEEDPWHAAISAIEAGNNNSLPMSKRKIRALPPRASGPQHCHNEPEGPITDVVTTPHTSKSRATSKVMAARIAAATAYSSDSDSDSDLGLAPPSPTPSTKKKSSVALEHNASLNKSAATSNEGSSSRKLYSDPSAVLKAIGQAAQEASQARANSNGGSLSRSGLSSAAAAEMGASASAALNRGVQAGQQAPQARVGNFAAQRLGRTGTSSSSSAPKKK
ncbi:hypothetical protein JCM5296_005412 [Sporobolomyces johnsonii]